MNYVMKIVAGLLLVLSVLITACSSSLQPVAGSQEVERVLSLEIPATANRADIEAKYNGKVLAWYPENNLAIVGLYKGELSALGDPNKDALVLPEVVSSGARAWGGGQRAWGGGKRAWGGGSATGPTTFSENIPLWQKVRLVEGQNLARNLGRGVKIAVIDSGLDLTHPAFAGRLAPASEWKDFIDNDNLPQDVAGGIGYGHGTGVADVILQVAPNATILPLRVLEPDGTGDLDDVVAAIDWAIQKGAKVINMSLGSSLDQKSMQAILKLIASHNMIAVASAGNNGMKSIEYPARHGAEVIGVGSVDKNDVKSTFSAYGKELDVMAPGEFVYTAYPSNQIGYWSGTSFAAPMVTGSIALVVGEGRVVKTKDLLKDKTDDISKLAGNRNFSKELGGRLNIESFVQMSLSK
jgi:thermitase